MGYPDRTAFVFSRSFVVLCVAGETMRRRLAVILLASWSVTAFAQAPATVGRWPESKANTWYDAQPWLVGSNYIPATAINELEMWQADTFDPKTIDKERGWHESPGRATLGRSL